MGGSSLFFLMYCLMYFIRLSRSCRIVSSTLVVGLVDVVLWFDDWLPCPRSALAPVAYALLPELWFAVVFSF